MAKKTKRIIKPAGILNNTTGILRLGKYIKRDRQLLLLCLPLLAYYLIFCYWPMYGTIIAFKDFRPVRGILASEWVGLKYFEQVFRNPDLGRLVRNTFQIGLYSLLWGFPVPIFFALCLNELKNKAFKKVAQTISYLPYFISLVVVVGLLHNFFSPVFGVVNRFYTSITGNPPINFMADTSWFRTMYIGSGVWQNFGWGAIIYLAALSGIDLELYDSAKVDGANRLQRILHITIPGIMSTIIILLILNMGRVMSVGFEKIILMYSPGTYEVADVISTYTYRRGIIESNFSFGAAVGLLNSVINIIFLITANYLSRKYSEVSLW